MGRPVTINGRELNINDAPFIEANAEYSVTVDDDGTVMVERTDLKAENARLRDLVHKVERFERIGCHECPHAGCGVDTLYDDDCPMRREIEQDKRELGIDIEEDE